MRVRYERVRVRYERVRVRVLVNERVRLFMISIQRNRFVNPTGFERGGGLVVGSTQLARGITRWMAYLALHGQTPLPP